MTAPEQPGSGRAPRAGLRNLGALYLGKALIGAARLFGGGGTTLPGRAALKVSPRIIPFMAGQLPWGVAAVTGTNGKTTTAALLAAVFKQGGHSCVHNSAGANLAWGVATTLVEAANWRAGLPAKMALLEIDEGAFPSLAESLRPRLALVTNIFRDQLDRFGGVQQVREAIQRGLLEMGPGTTAILNADDPLVAAMESGGGKTIYYGFDLPPSGAPGRQPEEELPCPRCGGRLIYTGIYYAHLGRYRCASCAFHRPEPDMKLRRFESAAGGGALLHMSLRGRSFQAELPLPGIYNLYNALAAAAAASVLGLPEGAIRRGFAGAAPPSGRMERRSDGSRNILLALIKNPAGADAVLRTLLEEAEGDSRIHFLIAVNDNIADGADISWLGEADFEQLAALGPQTGGVLFSGTRAAEARLRLQKAGFDTIAMMVEPSPGRALRMALDATAPGEKLIILANYTAMMQLRPLLDRRLKRGGP